MATMLVPQRVPLRRPRARLVKRICDIAHLVNEGPKPSAAELDHMDEMRYDSAVYRECVRTAPCTHPEWSVKAPHKPNERELLKIIATRKSKEARDQVGMLQILKGLGLRSAA